MDPFWAYNHTQGVINQALFNELVRRANQANAQADPGLLGNVLRQARSISQLNTYANQPPLPLFALPMMTLHPQPIPAAHLAPPPVNQLGEGGAEPQGANQPPAIVVQPPTPPAEEVP